jgi:hypothetical protein
MTRLAPEWLAVLGASLISCAVFGALALVLWP